MKLNHGLPVAKKTKNKNKNKNKNKQKQKQTNKQKQNKTKQKTNKQGDLSNYQFPMKRTQKWIRGIAYSVAWYHTLRSSNKHILLWKISNASFKDFLFVDVRN